MTEVIGLKMDCAWTDLEPLEVVFLQLTASLVVEKI